MRAALVYNDVTLYFLIFVNTKKLNPIFFTAIRCHKNEKICMRKTDCNFLPAYILWVRSSFTGGSVKTLFFRISLNLRENL